MPAPKYLNEITEKLKDCTPNFLVMVEDGDNIYWTKSGNCVAYGMARMMMQHIEDLWVPEDDEEET